jgi:hypothetical protein
LANTAVSRGVHHRGHARLLVQYAHAAIPMASGHAFEMMLLAFLILLAGNLFRGM